MSNRLPLPSSAVTAIALRFTAEIQAGRRPSIEAALDQAPTDEWPQLLQSLLIAETNARRARGEAPVAGEYLPRFPAHTAVVRSVVPEHVSPLPLKPAVVAAAGPAVVPPPYGSAGAVPVQRRRSRRRGLWAATAFLLIGLATTTVVLTVRRRPASAPPPPAPAPQAAPAAAGKNPLALLEPKRVSADPDRQLAEWVVGLGGRGTVRLDGGGRLPFGPETPLPKTGFAVTTVSIPPGAAGQWKSGDLQRLRGRERLSEIEFRAPGELVEADLAPLAGLPLRVLILDGPTVRAPGSFFASFLNLETLVLANTPDFADADLAALGKLGRLGTLTLNSPNLTVAGFRQLQNPMLRSLTLGDRVKLVPNAVRVLIRLPLQTFESHGGMTDDVFIEFAIFNELRRIRLRNTRLTDASLRAVVGLGKLEELRIEGSAITGPGLTHVAERKGLRVLDLSAAKLGNDGLAHLLGLPGLKELHLAGNPINDTGAALLAQIDGLEVLNLGATGITDVALRLLKKHGTLKTLVVTNTRVTAPAVRDFEAGTPGCKVIFGKGR